MFRDFRHRCTMIFKVEQTLKRAKTVKRNSTTCECILHQLAIKNVNVFVLITIYCQRNSIFLRPKNIQYLTDQNRGLSGLKNIWPVIMTGDLMSVIFSPGPCCSLYWSSCKSELYLCGELRHVINPAYVRGSGTIAIRLKILIIIDKYFLF